MTLVPGVPFSQEERRMLGLGPMEEVRWPRRRMVTWLLAWKEGVGSCVSWVLGWDIVEVSGLGAYLSGGFGIRSSFSIWRTLILGSPMKWKGMSPGSFGRTL